MKREQTCSISSQARESGCNKRVIEMAGLLNFAVETLLHQQVELIGPASVSLDSLWARRAPRWSTRPETGWTSLHP